LFVSVRDSVFQPNSITIDRGFPIRWTNDGAVFHTVTSDDALFDSGLIPRRNFFEVRFDSSGTFTYHCSIHAGMTGTVTVP
jgi:plastocyanin